MADARRKAEEALAAWKTCSRQHDEACSCGAWPMEEALRALLAASPEPATALQTLHACAKCRRMFYRPSHPEFGCDGTAVLMPDEAQPATAADAVAEFGVWLLAEWWENDCADLDGATVQEIAEETGLWHQVEQHADGVECEWCSNEGGCGELTEAGVAALDARRRG